MQHARILPASPHSSPQAGFGRHRHRDGRTPLRPTLPLAAREAPARGLAQHAAPALGEPLSRPASAATWAAAPAAAASGLLAWQLAVRVSWLLQAAARAVGPLRAR